MSHDAYRAPRAPLSRPGDPPAPRSAVVAVLLGYLAPVVLVFLALLVSRALGASAVLPTDGAAALAYSAGTGLAAGWIAVRYRRGPWLGVALALVALDALASAPALALGPLGLPPGTVLAQLAASAAGDLAGGWVARP